MRFWHPQKVVHGRTLKRLKLERNPIFPTVVYPLDYLLDAKEGHFVWGSFF